MNHESQVERGEVFREHSVDKSVATADPSQEDPLDRVVEEAHIVEGSFAIHP